MTSSTKPEVHNLSHCCPTRTESWPQVTRTENLVKFGRVVSITITTATTTASHIQQHIQVSNSIKSSKRRIKRLSIKRE